MPIPVLYQIHEPINLVIVRYLGVVSTDDVVTAYSAYLEDPGRNPDHNILQNLSGVTDMDIGFRQMLAMIPRLQPFQTFRAPGTRTATFAPDDVPFGLARMYQSLTDGRVSYEIGVFRQMDPALAFLGIQSDHPELQPQPALRTA